MENINGRENLGDPGVNRRILLKATHRKKV
jgi:hypothetical protein